VPNVNDEEEMKEWMNKTVEWIESYQDENDKPPYDVSQGDVVRWIDAEVQLNVVVFALGIVAIAPWCAISLLIFLHWLEKINIVPEGYTPSSGSILESKDKDDSS
jgi:hypothetical protein